MPTFPIPVFVACLLGFASLQLWLQRGRASPLAVLLMICAVQSMVIALGQHYGVSSLRLVQPLLASCIPPAAWLAYLNRASRKEALHGLGPLIATASLVVAPQFLDVLIPGMFVLYGASILLSAKNG
ncbi:MAG: AraC family transcriptional regulator, partial [Pseudomonadota bacterium]